MVDAPVSGGSEGAKNATLTIFVGGDAADVERARPVLTAMGRTITHVGPIGAGQAVKAVNQVILAGTYLGVAEGIVLAIKAGLDVEQVVEALGGGAAQSWVLANRSGRMIDNDYPLGFKVALHRKDLGIALDLAAQLGAVLPVSALAAQLETGLIAGGHGDDDMSPAASELRSTTAHPRAPCVRPRRTEGARGARTRRRRRRRDPVSRGRPTASGRRACRRSAAGSARRCTSSGRRPGAARGQGRGVPCGRTCRPGSPSSGR